MSPALAVNTLAYHGYDFDIAFAEIAGLGVSYVEPALISNYYTEMSDEYFSEPSARKMSRQIAGHGLEVLAVGAHMDMAGQGAVASFRRRMEFASELGASFVHTNTASTDKAKSFQQNLEALLPHAENLGLVITLENPGDPGENLLHSGEAGVDLVKRVGSPAVGLNYDFSNVFSFSRGRRRPEDEYVSVLPSVAHLHLKEIAKDRDGWKFVAIGQGVTDYDQILRTISARRSVPPLSIELPLRHRRRSDFAIALDRDQPPVPLETINDVLRRSVLFVKERLEAL
jgi:sugar phosphate isomerase/epimerase